MKLNCLGINAAKNNVQLQWGHKLDKILCIAEAKKAVTFQDSLRLEKYFASHMEDNISVCIWSPALSIKELLFMLGIPHVL